MKLSLPRPGGGGGGAFDAAFGFVCGTHPVRAASFCTVSAVFAACRSTCLTVFTALWTWFLMLEKRDMRRLFCSG